MGKLGNHEAFNADISRQQRLSVVVNRLLRALPATVTIKAN